MTLLVLKNKSWDHLRKLYFKQENLYYDTRTEETAKKNFVIGDDEGFYTEHLVLPASHTLLHLSIPRLQSVEHSGRFEPPGTRLHKLQSPQVSLQLKLPKYWQESMVLAAVNAPLK